MKRSASSLLMVVLLMSAVSIMAVTAVQVAILSSRQGADHELTTEAREMTQSAVEEALCRVDWSASNCPNNLLAWGEYGILTADPANSPYILAPVRRYLILQGSNLQCSGTLTWGASSVGSSCPYYDLAIRDTVAVAAGQEAQFNRVAFEAQDFPSGQVRDIPLLSGTQITFAPNLANVPGFTNVTYQLCTDYNYAVCAAPVSTGTTAFSISNISADGIHGLKITITYTGSPSPTSNLLSMSQCVATATYCVVGKGYTTADIVAYPSTDSQIRVYDIIDFHNGNPVIRETAQYYDNQGVLHP